MYKMDADTARKNAREIAENEKAKMVENGISTVEILIFNAQNQGNFCTIWNMPRKLKNAGYSVYTLIENEFQKRGFIVSSTYNGTEMIFSWNMRTKRPDCYILLDVCLSDRCVCTSSDIMNKLPIS